MSLSKQEVRSRYQISARYYDFALKLYGLLGIRKEYRARAIMLLKLRPGDTIVELGCGTGINFSLIMDQVGPEGRLIGVDISSKMLSCAKERVKREGWANVELVEGDIANYVFPNGTKGVLATGVMGYLDDCDRVIKAISQSLRRGGRIAIMDGKRPARMPSWFFNFFVWASRPFGVTKEYFDNHAWESVERYFQNTTFEQLYGGMLFISSGTAEKGVESSSDKTIQFKLQLESPGGRVTNGDPPNGFGDFDIDLARQVQKMLFPKLSPACKWGHISTKSRMAQGVGGDYFDFHTMSDECQVIYLGDVTGHGLHASMVMALLYGFFHQAFRQPCPCRDIVWQVNDFLQSFAVRSEEYDQFFSSTLFYCIINPRFEKMTYVNAGHPPPVVLRGSSLLSLPATAPPIGFFAYPEIGMETFMLKKGDRLLLYTDGITEAVNIAGESFGLNRLQEALVNSEEGKSDFLVKLFDDLKDFDVNHSPQDDCTAITVDFYGCD